jgi:hypothetical protein
MECTDIWQQRIRVSVKSPENIYAYFQSVQNVSGSHSPSNCSMHDKKNQRDEGAGEWSWQFTSTYCRVYNWIKLCCNSSTRLQAEERLGWNRLGFGPSSFLGGYRRFGQLHSLRLQGWRFVKFYWKNEDKQTTSQTIKNKWGDFCKARVDFPCSV